MSVVRFVLVAVAALLVVTAVAWPRPLQDPPGLPTPTPTPLTPPPATPSPAPTPLPAGSPPGLRAELPPMQMILPPPTLRKCGIAARAQRIEASVFT